MKLGIKNHIRRFFGFTARETNGFMILLPLTLLIVFSEPIYRNFLQGSPKPETPSVNIDSLKLAWQPPQSTKDTSALQVRHFEFDPNKATRDELMELGFTDKLAGQLIAYRNKGGQFRYKSDLLRLYGMDSAFYNEIEPVIELPETSKQVNQPLQAPDSRPKTIHSLVDINSADSIQLQSVYGVGPVLSKRIIKYRDRLGGFVSQNQLNEVYGLDSAVVSEVWKKFFIESTFAPVKIRINEIGEQDLANHPYLSKQAAKSIVTYRFQHGNFGSIQDLEKIQSINSAMILKISPYLSFE